MNQYRVTMTVPVVGGPSFEFTIEAPDEHAAEDFAFEQVFHEHPEFSAFRIDALTEVWPHDA